MATPEREILLPEFKKLFVLPNETFASLAQQHGILDPQYLRLFHNDYCELDELLGPELQEGQVVYIPSKREIVKINAKATVHQKEAVENASKVQLAPDRTLPFYPLKIHNRYQVVVTLDTENTQQEVRYVVAVKWLKQIDNTHILEFNQSGYLYNGEEPEAKIDNLARQCAESLYPLEIAIDDQCHLLGVANAPAIRTRWKENKQYLIDYFSDSYSHNYIGAMDQSLHNFGTIHAMLQKNLFLSIFFPSLYNTPFTGTLSAMQERSIPIITGSSPVLFVIENTLDEYISAKNMINIHQSGYTINTKPIEDAHLKIEEYEPQEDRTDNQWAFNTIDYELDRNTFYINILKATYTVMLPDKEKNIHITIEKITV